ncbi:MAG TPA: hypothetical protein VK324_07485, partial [Tepidisphaeraceae bacterium]|nr:hypothetical protein [Tepidisphaeraceae bacterium]
ASPEAWRVLRGLIETSRSTAVATPFVGVLRSPAGVERLVAMELYAKGSYPALFVAGRVVEPGTLARPPRTVAYTRGNSYVAVKPTERARVHAGRVAPTDPSRLTIEFEVDGRRGRIDAWLTEDDEVVFAHHVEPSTSPATAR